MVRLYWNDVHRRAFGEAAQTCGLETRARVVIAALGIVLALLALAFWGSTDASRDEAIVRLVIAFVIVAVFPFIYVWKLVSVPAAMKAEADANLLAVQSELQAVTDRLANSIKLSAEVETDMVDNDYSKLKWKLIVKNTSAMPLQFSRIVISKILNGSIPETHTGSAGILTIGDSLTFTFPFEYGGKDGEIILAVSMSYGLIGKPAARQLTETLKVPFQPRGAITFSSCGSQEYHDQAI